MQMCQRCQKSTATVHITDVLGPEQFEEVHHCEQCVKEIDVEGAAKPAGKGVKELTGAADKHACQHCGITFVDFRNSGRLGCPNDYSSFREDLLPLLENIHGETQHCGKAPSRYPQAKKTEAELTQLRKRLNQAITCEHYEEAARLRDRIKALEEA